MPLLEVSDLSVRYGGIHAVQGIGFSVGAGRVLTLLGRNGAGKSTTLRALMALGPRAEGRVMFQGRPLLGRAPYEIARSGLAFVPETRAIFPSLSVRENLMLAARPNRADRTCLWSAERIFELFPRLRERLDSGGGELSGGEQQMLSIARALMTNPTLLLLDEPTEGLAPIVVEQLREALAKVKATGLAIILVEQNLSIALSLADEVLVLGKGLAKWAGSTALFNEAKDIQSAWLSL